VVTEQRKSRRFDLKLPLTLLRCSGNVLLDQSHETANISSNGVLFRSAAPIDIGAVVEYTVTLMPAVGTQKPVHLHCLGKVVRQADNETVAATLERYEFVRAD
jgi:PilZ domain